MAMAQQYIAGSPPTEQSEEFILQTRFYVALRRASGRVIDLVWFRQNADYANAVLDFAETISDREVRDAARRLRYPEFFR
jgi:hypothetical protein